MLKPPTRLQICCSILLIQRLDPKLINSSKYSRHIISNNPRFIWGGFSAKVTNRRTTNQADRWPDRQVRSVRKRIPNNQVDTSSWCLCSFINLFLKKQGVMFLLLLFVHVHDIFLASLQEGTTMSQNISLYSDRLVKSKMVICNTSEVYFAMSFSLLEKWRSSFCRNQFQPQCATHDVAKKSHPKNYPFHSFVFTTRPPGTTFGTLGQCGICWLRSCGVSLWGTSVGAVILRSSRMVDGFDGARPPQRGIPKQKRNGCGRTAVDQNPTEKWMKR